MHPKILIKLYIVLFVIDLALLGHFTGWTWASIISALNIFLLFVVLIQERNAFSDFRDERVLFRADVFGLLAIAVGVLAADLWACVDEYFLTSYYWIIAFILGGVFYLVSNSIFRLYTGKGKPRISSVRIIAASVVIMLVVLLGGMMREGTEREYGLLEGVSTKLTTRRSVVRSVNTPSTNQIENGTGDQGTGDDVQQAIIELEEQVDELVGQEVIEIVAENDLSQPSENRKFVVSNELLDVPLTFGNVLPELVDTYGLVATQDYTFTQVSRSSELYPAFAAAHEYRMIGRATSPDQPVLCKHVMVLVGLAEGWDLIYSSANVFDVYRQEAIVRGYTNFGCEDQNQQALFANLP